MNYIPLKYCAVMAIIVPIVFALLWIASATLDGEWQFGVDSLSRMGISENALAAALFNYGCMFVGICGIIIGIGMAVHIRGPGMIVGALYAIGTLFLMLVGVFPMDQPDIHYAVASTFGVFVSLALCAAAAMDYYNMWHPELDAMIVILSLILIGTQEFAMWEAVLVIFTMYWTAVQGIKMIVLKDAFPIQFKKLTKLNDYLN